MALVAVAEGASQAALEGLIQGLVQVEELEQ
jgi:hypothetical protein